MTNKNADAQTRTSLDTKKPMAGVRILLGLGAAVLFAFGLTGYLQFDQFSAQQYWWFMVAAFAVAIIAISISGDWQKAGLIAATFVAGFGVQLALKDPVWFQHVLIRPVSGFLFLSLAVLGLQAMASGSVLLRKKTLTKVFRAILDIGVWRVLLMAAFLVVASRSTMEPFARQDLFLFLKQFSAALIFLGLNVASFIALMIALPGHRLRGVTHHVTNAISLPGDGGQIRYLDGRLPYLLAVLVFAVSTWIALVSLDGVPHLDDIIYLFQAKYFAGGMVALPIPPSVEAFDHYLMDIYQDRWFAVTFPGWPLALAIGELINMPWIINPILGAIGILLLHRFMTSVSDRGTANLTTILMAVSPWYVSMSATMLLHTFTYVLILGAWVLLVKSRSRMSIVMPLIAGALMGWLFLTRPLEGLLIGTLTGLWLLSYLQDRRHWKTVVLYGIGAIIIGATIFPYHAYLTGDPMVPPLNAYYEVFWGPGSNALGFGPERGAVPDWGNVDVFKGHSPLEALINAHQNLYETNFSLLGWGGASLAFVLIFVMWGKWTRLAAAMTIIIVATFGLYSLYWFYGGYYAGARYWFLMLVPLLVLTTFGITTCIRKCTQFFPDGMVAGRIGVGVGFLCLCSLLIFESWLGFNRYPEINGFHDEYQKLARQEEFRNSLVFINMDKPKEYSSASWLNDFSPGSEVPIFAINLGAASNREIAAGYPDRRIFFVDGRTKTRPHITVIRGPLALEDLE